MILLQFVLLLAVHWIADFVLQTHWMASNKSKSNVALGAHVATYTAVLFGALPVIFPGSMPSALGAILTFTVVNGALHFATDYCTSRWTSRLFAAWMKDTQRTDHIHNFFVVVGLDQLIHQVTLAATMWWLLT